DALTGGARGPRPYPEPSGVRRDSSFRLSCIDQEGSDQLSKEANPRSRGLRCRCADPPFYARPQISCDTSATAQWKPDQSLQASAMDPPSAPGMGNGMYRTHDVRSGRRDRLADLA